MFYIYKISTENTDNIYIGFSSNPNKRFKKHMSDLRKNKHHSVYFQRYFNKHKEDKYFLDIIYSSKCEKDARLKEEELLNNSLKLFNVSKTSSGGDLISYHPLNKDIRKKISEKQKIRYLNIIERKKASKPLENNPNWKGGITKNIICPICSKRKIYTSKVCKECSLKDRSGSNNAFYGKKHSQEAIEKISNAKKILGKVKKPSNSIKVKYNNIIYNSFTDLSKFLNCSVSTVKNRANNPNFKNYEIINKETFNDYPIVE